MYQMYNILKYILTNLQFFQVANAPIGLFSFTVFRKLSRKSWISLISPCPVETKSRFEAADSHVWSCLHQGRRGTVPAPATYLRRDKRPLWFFGVWRRTEGKKHRLIHMCVLFKSNVWFIECRFDNCDDVNECFMCGVKALMYYVCVNEFLQELDMRNIRLSGTRNHRSTRYSSLITIVNPIFWVG